MNTHIKLKTVPADRGKEAYEKAELWIEGVPFSADLIGDVMERQIHRIAEEMGEEVIDLRAKKTP